MNNIAELNDVERKSAFTYFLAFLQHKVDQEGAKQIDIAKAIKVRPEYVNRVYNGKQKCSVKVQEQIAHYFGTTYLEAIGTGRGIVEAEEHLKDNSTPPGEIFTQLNGPGRRATDRILETDIVSFVSQWAAKCKKTEETLAKLQNIIENLSEGIVLFDTDLKIEYQNRSHREMFGGTYIGVSCNSAHGCEKHTCQCPSTISQKTGMPASATFPFNKGTVSALTTPIRDGSGNITGYVTVLRDITEQQKLLTMSEKALEMIDRAVFLYDENLNIRFVNAKLKEITGATDNDLVTLTNFLNYLKEREIFRNFDKVEKMITEAREKKVEANVKIYFKSGKTYLYNAKPMFTNNNEYIGRMVVFTPFA